jgi:hypothetical protein
MRRVGCIIFQSVLRFNFFKVQLVCEAVNLSLWEILVRKFVVRCCLVLKKVYTIWLRILLQVYSFKLILNTVYIF